MNHFAKCRARVPVVLFLPLLICTLVFLPLAAQDNDPVAALLEAVRDGSVRIVDLTHPLSDAFPKWPGDSRGFEAETYATIDQQGYFTRSVWMLEHFATHLDAPAHFPGGREHTDEIPPERLIAPAVVVDISAQATKDADYRLSSEDIVRWEETNGAIPPGAIVLARTGWALKAGDGDAYRNQDAEGKMHFPGFSVEALEVLLARGVAGLGIDTMSVDWGASTNFAVHQRSHAAGLFHLENLADLSDLPSSGAMLVVAPVKLKGGSGGPVRVFALLPQ